MISQLFPGDAPEKSYTNQIFLMEQAPETEDQEQAAQEQFKLLEYVVREEDYATGLDLQKNLSAGAKSHVLFGKNERGGQQFHQWVDSILQSSDENLTKLFRTG